MKQFIKGIRGFSLLMIFFGLENHYGFSLFNLASKNSTRARGLLGFEHDVKLKKTIIQFLFMNFETKGYA